MQYKSKKGDLELLTLVEHTGSDKKFAIMGKFKGNRKEVILARVGEGPADPRSSDMIRATAECLVLEIQRIYAGMAMARALA